MTEARRFGPGFQDAGSRLYRAEYAAISVAVLAYLVWRGLFLGGLDVLQVIFWAIFPDLATLLPIGLASRQKQWPAWGAALYNAIHNVLLWGAVFLGMWAWLGTPNWALLGWLGHITTDRAVGYGLRRQPGATAFV